LIGSRGGERILAEDWAAALGTINYEVTCGLSPRVPREVVGGPAEPGAAAGGDDAAGGAGGAA
jgi:hypothetical protein